MITCEHASNELPARVKNLRISQEDLDSHRGYDIGAFAVYEELVSKFKPDFYSSGRYSRLFVDLNRSLRNNKFASPAGIAYHESYWGEVEKFVAQNLPEKERVLPEKLPASPAIVHLAIHSFTPILDGRTRNADIGILYDPSRPAECKIADIIVAEIRVRFPQYKVRRNYPYQGKTDGLCTALRKKFDPHKTGRYVGFEIEINQKLLSE